MRAAIARLPLDAWDVLGAVGLGVLAAGVWDVFGRGAAGITVGGLLVLAYVARETRVAALLNRNRREG